MYCQSQEKSCCWQTTAILSWRRKKMVLKNTIVFLIALLVMFGVAQSHAQPTDSPDCGSVALDLSSSRGNLKGSAPKLSALCRRTLRGEASLAVNKDGSGMTQSPTDSLKEMSDAQQTIEGYCPDCRSGSIDASSLIPTPP
ncbi:uncharacterized protein [Elaeis guineensis]|uniref:Uncharacterized protein LOC105042313 isoform X2 n=1 Tax=Elaeis guineensis var. tenera TaxID=51953 RepID=A0A8N4I833_ELAGV|nr:uncharacterized protein LOC105042313 isoform X2 [Elaeis guineensis]